MHATLPQTPQTHRVTRIARRLLQSALALMAGVALATPAAAVTWTVDPSTLTAIETSMALAPSGTTHLALRPTAGTILYKTRTNGVYGSTETVDATSGHFNPVIAVDAAGTPNVIYRTSSNLYFAKRYSATQWGGFVNTSSPDLVQPITSTFVGALSLAVDPSGNPHIAYYSTIHSAVVHAWHDGSGWHLEEIYPSSLSVPYGLISDGAGTLHCAVSRSGGGMVYLTKTVGGVWSVPEVALPTATGHFGKPAIALSSGGQARIAFTVTDAVRSLQYVTRSAGGWGSPVVVDNSSDIGAYLSLALESDQARIVYWNRTAWDVRSAWQCSDGSFQLATIDASPASTGAGNEPPAPWLGLLGSGAPVLYYPNNSASNIKSAANGAPIVITGMIAAGGATTTKTMFSLPADCTAPTTPLDWELRVSTSAAITSQAAWNAATVVASGSNPQGTSFCIPQQDLTCGTSFWFAAKYTDRYGVLSGLSNSPKATTKCIGGIEVACDPGLVTENEGEDALGGTSLALSLRGANPTSQPVGLGYSVPASAAGAAMRINIYDVSGRMVRNLANGTAAAGVHETSWNLQDETGRAVPRGLYFVRMALGRDVRTRSIFVTR